MNTYRRGVKLYRRIKLFLGIVWREDWFGGRIPVKTAWEVAGVVTA